MPRGCLLRVKSLGRTATDAPERGCGGGVVAAGGFGAVGWVYGSDGFAWAVDS